MDFHAHLCGGEVSGYLAGSWDPAAKVLTIERAFPVKDAPAAGGGGGPAGSPVAVMDDHRHQQNVIEFVYFKKVVGWYHSHAGGHAQPTSLDLKHHWDAQVAHQQASDVPFIGAVMTPYAPSHDPSSVGTHWFHAQQRNGELAAMKLVADVAQAVAREAQLHELQEQLLKAQIRQYAQHEQRTPMAQVWRDNMTHLDKLLATLRGSLPDNCFSEQHKSLYVQRLRDFIVASFAMQNNTHGALLQGH